MITLNAIGGVEYGILASAELPSMVSLLAEAFSRYDPLAVAIGITSQELEEVVAAYGRKALAEQLSIVARRADTEELVGALLAEDFGTPPPDEMADITPRFAPIGALLDGLGDQYRASRNIIPGAYLHLFMVGVAHHTSGRGVAHHLLTACLANGKARGYRRAVTEATGEASQHLCRKLGFREILAATYKDFVFNDQRVFSSIVGPEATLLMDREL